MTIPPVIIEDLRNGEFSSIPATEIFQQIIPVLRKGLLIGVRKIILLDHDYRRSKASARYVPVKGTKAADIEIYFDWGSSIPSSLRHNRMYLTYWLGHLLGHELYHHYVRGQRRERKPEFKIEQQKADKWAKQTAWDALTKIFPNEYQEEWKRIQDIWRQEKQEHQE